VFQYRRTLASSYTVAYLLVDWLAGLEMSVVTSERCSKPWKSIHSARSLDPGPLLYTNRFV